MDAATLEAALVELDADSLDHLGYLMRERAARLRADPKPPPKPSESEPIHVPAAAIWRWVAEDMVRAGYDRRVVVEVVGELAGSVDHLPEPEVENLLVAALVEASA